MYTTGKKNFDLRFELFGRYLGTAPEKAMIHLNQCVQVANQLGDSLLIVKTSNARGTVLRQRGDLKQAIRTFEGALATARRNEYCDQIMYLLNNLALSYTELSSFDQALRYHFESLKFREEQGDAFDVSITLNNIGTVYHELKDLESALDYYERSYKIKKENGIQHDTERSLLNIGLVLIDAGKYDMAESRIREVFIICETSMCRPEMLLEAHSAYGKVLIMKKEYHESKTHLLKSISLAKSLDLSKTCATNYYWIALLEFRINEWDSALTYLDLSDRLAQKSGFQKVILENYLLYGQIFKARREFERALDFQIRYNELNSEIVNGDLIRKISRIETEFAERENSTKIAAQSRILALQQDSLNQQEMLNLSLGIIASLAIILAAVLVKLNRKKQEVNRMLDERVRERTDELRKSSHVASHVQEEQAVRMRWMATELTAMLATFKGLSNNASKDLSSREAAYFREAEANIRKMRDLAVRHFHLV